MKRHHLVPKMLLRRFADADGRLTMVARQPPHAVTTTTVAKACREAGYYRIEIDDVAPEARAGHDPEAMESLLSRVESDATHVLDALAAGEFPLSYEDRFRLSLFVALQFFRGWRVRDDMNELATMQARATLRERLQDTEAVRASLRELGEDVTDEAVAAFRQEVLTSPYRVELTQPHAVQWALRLAYDSQDVFYFRPWRLLRFPRPVLLTSDQPVAVWAPHQRLTAPPPALRTARDLFLPIDRRTALVFGSGRNDQVVEERRLARAARINAAIARSANRWVFHHPDDRPLDGIELGPRDEFVEEIVEVSGDDGSVLGVRSFVRRPPLARPGTSTAPGE